MKETFKLMCEDGGWYDGLCMIAGAITGIAGMFLMIAIFG